MVTKKMVVILVIVAIVLASASIYLNFFNDGKDIATSFSNNNINSEQNGQVGIGIIPPVAEDKGAVK